MVLIREQGLKEQNMFWRQEFPMSVNVWHKHLPMFLMLVQC